MKSESNVHTSIVCCLWEIIHFYTAIHLQTVRYNCWFFYIFLSILTEGSSLCYQISSIGVFCFM